MSLYSDLNAIAGDVLSTFGQIVTLRRRRSSDYDVATGQADDDPGIIYSGSAVVSKYPQKMVDGKSVMTGDVRVTLAATATMVEPVAGDFIDIGSRRYSVVQANPVDPGGEAVIYKLQARL